MGSRTGESARKVGVGAQFFERWKSSISGASFLLDCGEVTARRTA